MSTLNLGNLQDALMVQIPLICQKIKSNLISYVIMIPLT